MEFLFSTISNFRFNRNHGKDLLLLDITSWLKKDRWQGFSKRWREDWLGFLLAWGFVGVLIFIAWITIQF